MFPAAGVMEIWCDWASPFPSEMVNVSPVTGLDGRFTVVAAPDVLLTLMLQSVVADTVIAPDEVTSRVA
jgi:hypothetical protein